MLLCLTITLNFLIDEMNGKKTRIYQVQETKVPWTAESTSWKETKWNIAIQHNNVTIKNMKGPNDNLICWFDIFLIIFSNARMYIWHTFHAGNGGD